VGQGREGHRSQAELIPFGLNNSPSRLREASRSWSASGLGHWPQCTGSGQGSRLYGSKVTARRDLGGALLRVGSVAVWSTAARPDQVVGLAALGIEQVGVDGAPDPPRAARRSGQHGFSGTSPGRHGPWRGNSVCLPGTSFAVRPCGFPTAPPPRYPRRHEQPTTISDGSADDPRWSWAATPPKPIRRRSGSATVGCRSTVW
jgi:hypothetical protein